MEVVDKNTGVTITHMSIDSTNRKLSWDEQINKLQLGF